MAKKYLEDMTADEKRAIIKSLGGDTEHLLTILIELQSMSKYSYIDESTANVVADTVGLSIAHVHDVVTFYEMLESKPSAEYIIQFCNSVACHFAKGKKTLAMLENELGITVGEETPDKKFTIRHCPCVGACEMAPVIKIGDEVYGNLTPEKLHQIIEDLRAR